MNCQITEETKSYPGSTPWVLNLKWSQDKGVYNLHGLWYDRSARPGSDTDNFSSDMISDQLLEQMEINWNSDRHKEVELSSTEQKDSDEGELDTRDKNESVLLGSDYQFWAHQWNKHGRIAGMTPDAYFRLALRLLQERRHLMPTVRKASAYEFNLDEDLTEISNTLPETTLQD
jgi:ribonuclease I